MRHTGRSLILLLSVTMAAAAVGADTEVERVNQIFAVFDKPGSPGCSVGAIRDGKFVYRKSFGYASLELGVRLTPESVFYMASVSKQFTAASIVLAAAQGRLSLDDDVRKYLPELPDYGYRVTLWQMLHQTSGFRDFLDLVFMSGRDAEDLSSPAAILRLIARQKALNNVPGDEWVYSNSNYFLLGEVVRRATGHSLAQFAAANIFQPLGMTHSLFYDDNTVVVPRRVAAYDRGKSGTFLVDWSTTYDIVGGGGLMSNIDDLLYWDSNFYNDKLGKGMLARELQSPGVLNNGNQIDYAMGLSLGQYRGLPIVEHNGALFGYGTALLRFPQQKFSAVVLCNLSSSDPENLARSVADIYLAAEFTGPAHPITPAGLRDPTPFAGTYLDPKTKTIYRFTANQGKLVGWGAVLRRIDNNRFYDLGSNIITFTNVKGVMHCSLAIPGEIYFSGDQLKAAQISETALKKLVGNYYSVELDATYTLSVEYGNLMVQAGDKPPIEFHAAVPDKFYSNDFRTLVVSTDASGKIRGLKLFTQAARGVTFKRVS